jgi:hypothetical protein
MDFQFEDSKSLHKKIKNFQGFSLATLGHIAGLFGEL